MIEIVRATVDNAEKLSILSAITFKEAFGHTCSPEDMQEFINTQYSKEKLLQQLADDKEFYFIAYVGTIAAGYIRLKEDYTDYPDIKKYKALELKRIYVLKEFQSQKIGGQFIEFIFNLCMNLEYEAVWLGVWEHNVKAIKFYNNHGFSDTGFTHKFYIGNNESTDKWFIKILEKQKVPTGDIYSE